MTNATHSTPEERFWAKIDTDGPNGCWIWTGYVNPSGYGRGYYAKKARAVHRVTYEVMVGPIPDGLEIDHLCRVKVCCNPEHLEPVTRSVNQLRIPERQKDFCSKGHALTEDNLYKRADRPTWRICHTCQREQQRASWHKRSPEQKRKGSGARSHRPDA